MTCKRKKLVILMDNNKYFCALKLYETQSVALAIGRLRLCCYNKSRACDQSEKLVVPKQNDAQKGFGTWSIFAIKRYKSC